MAPRPKASLGPDEEFSHLQCLWACSAGGKSDMAVRSLSYAVRIVVRVPLMVSRSIFCWVFRVFPEAGWELLSI